MQQPIKISNLSVSPTATISFNKGALIHDVQNHSMPFQFTEEQLFQTTLINTLIESSSGPFNVSGTIKWMGEAYVPPESTKKQVTLTDTLNGYHLRVARNPYPCQSWGGLLGGTDGDARRKF